MTHHDLISSYIDNELTAGQEQEFLISLAANDNLRSSFRTELVLKNIVHRDESLITPPRALRASVFAAIGLSAGLTAAAPDAAQAASTPVSTSTATTTVSQSGSFFKTLFATKMNALFTTLSLSVATLVGFVGHDVIVGEPVTTQSIQSTKATPSASRVSEPVQTTETIAEKPVANTTRSNGSRVATRITRKPATPATDQADPKPETTINGTSEVSGSGDIDVNPPVIKAPQK
jgi:hypothetical protein